MSKHRHIAPLIGQCPTWARWIAQDQDGTWWAYEAEPHIAESSWYENEVGRSRRLDKTEPCRDWQNQLYAVG